MEPKISIKRIKTFHQFFRKNEGKRILALYGGAGSGKSQSIIEELVEKFITQRDIRIFIARKTSPALEKSAFQMAVDIFKTYGILDKITITHRPFTARFSSNICWFEGLDQPEKKKSLNLNYAYLEEATEFTEEDMYQVSLRLRRDNKYECNKLYLSFNPTLPYHWSAQLIGKEDKDTAIHHSTYKDNPFLPGSYVDVLKGLETRNPNLYKIYTLGQYGMPENIVYSHWQEFSKAPLLGDSYIAYGLDFGYTNPTAMVEVRFYQGGFYATEKLYETHLTNRELIEKIIHLRDTGYPIYCDSAEPQRIAELSGTGMNAQPSEKNVRDGINYVRSNPLFINTESKNLIKEIRGYQFQIDKMKMVKEDPIKGNDHLLDALRYCIFSMRVGGGLPPTVSDQVKKIPSLPDAYHTRIQMTREEWEETHPPTIPYRGGKRKIPGL